MHNQASIPCIVDELMRMLLLLLLLHMMMSLRAADIRLLSDRSNTERRENLLRGQRLYCLVVQQNSKKGKGKN